MLRAACLLPATAMSIAACALPVDPRVETLLAQMSLAEKIGQLTQYSGDWTATGPVTIKSNLQDSIRAGQVGSMLNVLGTRYTRQYQELAMQSRFHCCSPRM